MRSASACAAATICAASLRATAGSIRFGAGGAGGSCWKAKSSSTNPVSCTGASDKLLIVVLRAVAARDRQRAGVLELADDPDDPALRLLDDRAALRRLQLELLEEHLGAALRHVAENLLLDVVGDAAQGQGQVLLLDLLEHLLHAAVVDLHDVVEHEQQRADLLGQLVVELGQAVQHVALGGAVGGVQDVRERLDATGGGVLLRDHARQLLPQYRL